VASAILAVLVAVHAGLTVVTIAAALLYLIAGTALGTVRERGDALDPA
jgi:hypothetical protein